METDKFTNTHLLPSTVIDSYWLYEADKLKDSNNNIGKWMLFYPKNEMNNNWKLTKKLYNENALNGVVSMKCSTNKKNKNATNDNGIIIFYCSDSNNWRKVNMIGKNIIDKMNYTNSQYLYYKTDAQTQAGAYQANGKTKNYKYYIKNHLLKPEFELMDD